MKRDEFKIGDAFYCGERCWRCTDVGTRVIVAMRIDPVEVVRTDLSGDHKETRILTFHEADAEGWFNGPPYAVAEEVFDENDQEACTMDPSPSCELDSETDRPRRAAKKRNRDALS